MPILAAKMKILLILAKKCPKIAVKLFFLSALFQMKTRVSLKHFVTDCGYGSKRSSKNKGF